MRHIEDNECPKISNIRLLREQSKKIFIKEALERGQGDNLPIVPDPKDFDDIDGGVKLDPLEKSNREAMVNRPKVNEEDQTESVSSLLARRHWPRIGEQPGPMGEDDDLMEFSPSRDKASKGEEGATQQETIQRGPFGINFLPDAGQTLRMLDEHWDSTKFFNSFNGKYICPGCGAGFAAMKEFEEHVLASSRGKKNVQCVFSDLLAWTELTCYVGVPDASVRSRARQRSLPTANRLPLAARSMMPPDTVRSSTS